VKYKITVLPATQLMPCPADATATHYLLLQ